MTAGQKQILTELKPSWPVILTGDLSSVIWAGCSKEKLQAIVRGDEPEYRL
jgi:hypothetical protein